MTTLFNSAAPAPEDPRHTLADQLRQSAAVGGGLVGGLAGGGTIIWGVVELLKSEPDKGFRLLHDWGPWCFLIGIVLFVLYMLSISLIRARSESDARMAAAFDRLAVGQERVAAAAEAAAAKDDRQIQQIEVMQTTVVMKIERILRHLHAQDRALERLEDKAGVNRPHDVDEGDEKA